MSRIDRRGYASLYGPTAGDQIRLADTDLWIEIEHDYTATGDEMVFGGGKSIRESMGQGLTTRDQGALDVVITNTVILDHWGIVRADVGIRDGRIVAIGKSGNPDIMDGVHPKLLIGPSTDVIAGLAVVATLAAFPSPPNAGLALVTILLLRDAAERAAHDDAVWRHTPEDRRSGRG